MISPGEHIGCVAPQSRGTTYDDGGFDISPATAEGAALIEDGVGYIDPRGIGWPSLWDRPDAKQTRGNS